VWRSVGPHIFLVLAAVTALLLAAAILMHATLPPLCNLPPCCPCVQVVELILKNQSVLHGREMHLSVADIAHLAMLREPTGRVAE
jgi:hypothetical protein